MSSSELPSWAAGYVDNAQESNAPASERSVQHAPVQHAPVQHASVQQPPRDTTRSAPSPQRRGGPALLINDPHARIEGRFETSEEIEIGCDLTGEIKAGRLHITQTGNVSGVVHVVDAVIAGRFEGDIVATGSLEVLPTGYLGGNVQTDSLSIARGASFRGQVQQLSQAQQYQQPIEQAEPEAELDEPEPEHEERRATGPLLAVEFAGEVPVSETLLTPVALPIDIQREGAA